MPLAERIFDNFFDDPKITPSRFLNCSQTTLQRLIAANGDNAFDDLIAQLQPAINVLGNELGDINVDVAVQRGATLTVDEIINNFKDTMSAKEGVIADAIGGRGTAAYLEFYPQGITGYRKANKTNIEALAYAVKQAATKYADSLNPILVTLLQSFYGNYKDARGEQQQKVGNVEDGRSTRSAARSTLEIAMLVAVHTIAAKFPYDQQKCISFFDFSLLYPSKREHEILKGVLAPEQLKAVLNRALNEDDKITIANMDDNSNIVAYLAATANDPQNGKFIEVKPGKKVQVKAIELGDINNTFLIIRNISPVNDGSYRVEVPLEL